MAKETKDITPLIFHGVEGKDGKVTIKKYSMLDDVEADKYTEHDVDDEDARKFMEYIHKQADLIVDMSNKKFNLMKVLRMLPQRLVSIKDGGRTKKVFKHFKPEDLDTSNSSTRTLVEYITGLLDKVNLTSLKTGLKFYTRHGGVNIGGIRKANADSTARKLFCLNMNTENMTKEFANSGLQSVKGIRFGRSIGKGELATSIVFDDLRLGVPQDLSVKLEGSDRSTPDLCNRSLTRFIEVKNVINVLSFNHNSLTGDIDPKKRTRAQISGADKFQDIQEYFGKIPDRSKRTFLILGNFNTTEETATSSTQDKKDDTLFSKIKDTYILYASNYGNVRLEKFANYMFSGRPIYRIAPDDKGKVIDKSYDIIFYYDDSNDKWKGWFVGVIKAQG